LMVNLKVKHGPASGEPGMAGSGDASAREGLERVADLAARDRHHGPDPTP